VVEGEEEMKNSNRNLILAEDEYQFISNGGRCEACDHLNALHNQHCCEFCVVPGCLRAWGEVEEQDGKGKKVQGAKG
jgi:hypothetical protein